MVSLGVTLLTNKLYYSKEKRILWYKSVDKDKRTVKETCSIFSISRKTYYKWRKKDFKGEVNFKNKELRKNTKLTSEVKIFIENENVS